MPKITKYETPNSIRVGGKSDPDPKIQNAKWWVMDSDANLAASIFGVVKYLKENQGWRQHQAALHARMYGNLPVWNYLGINLTKLNAQNKFPTERPTLNVVQSCTDALVSRMVQSKPKPMFLTEGGDYKRRKLAKDLNKFVDGEFYAVKAYQLGEGMLRDATILGDGLLKVYRTEDKKVGVERTLCTELFVDENDGMYGFPTQMHQLKIVDRGVAVGMFPKFRAQIESASPAYFDASTDSRSSIASLIMIVESWHLRGSKNSTDGRHVIAIDNAVLLDEKDWKKDKFPFVKFPYAPRTLGYWAQGLPEQLMGIQSEINRLLYTIQQALHLCGIPKWLVEEGSKIVSAHINNQIGGILKYQGTMPELKVFQCLPPELYGQLERLVNYAYQQSGISLLTAASQKPKGLSSGTALREYDDIQSDRFAYLSQRYERAYDDLAFLMFDEAVDISKETGKYSTIYPGKRSIFRINLPKINLDKEEFIIQSFPVSAFSNDPAQRKQEIIDDMQAGLLDPQEGRRLLDYPDLAQENELLNAPEERLLKILDAMVEDGEYQAPEPEMDLVKAETLCLQYLNKFAMEDLEEERMQLIRNFLTQVRTLKMQAQSAMAPPQGIPQPQAQPEPAPTSPMVPNVPTAAA